MFPPLDVGLIIASITTLASVLAWYRSQTRNTYAREREISHIFKNQEQAAQLLHQVSADVDDLGDRIARLEVLIITALSLKKV